MKQSNKILHANKSVMYNSNRNAYEEVEYLKLQLAVDENELKLMLWEKQCKDVKYK